MKKIVLIFCLLFSVAASAFETTAVKNFIPEQTYQLSRQEVFWIYSLKTRFWENGQRVVVYYLDFDHPIHKDFVRDVLRTTPIRFENSVNTYVNLGTAGFFRRVNNEIEMYRSVALTPGAVGYVGSDVLLVNEGSDRVKTVRISN